MLQAKPIPTSGSLGLGGLKPRRIWTHAREEKTKVIDQMAIRDPKEVFIIMLSDVRRNAERSNKFFQELGDLAQDEQVKEILQARALISDTILTRLNECFKLIGAQPAKLDGKIQ